MELFSQRKGITSVKSVMQVDTMDKDLRNSLWNALTRFYWQNLKPGYGGYFHLSENVYMKNLCVALWEDYFKTPVDTIDDYWNNTLEIIRKYFFSCRWYQAYNFIEFVANSYYNKSLNQRFMDDCNNVLKEELSAYRFVGGKITQITKEEEIAEIEGALKIPISPVQQHLNRALELLSDRKEPDYRNSIKESISAVEAICKLMTKNKDATLTTALEVIEKGKKLKWHPALGRAFKELFFYTNNAEGIRHGLSDEPNLDTEDAKFMLVSCSAFINYLIVKASKAGIKL